MRSLLALLAVTACAHQPAPPRPDLHAGERERGMANCPSAVASARTEVIDNESGVDLVITAPTAEAKAEIAERAARQVRMGDPAGLPPHTGMHGGPGAIGHCPVIHDATNVTMERTADGVVIRVRTILPDRVKALQEETRARVSKLSPHAAR